MGVVQCHTMQCHAMVPCGKTLCHPVHTDKSDPAQSNVAQTRTLSRSSRSGIVGAAYAYLYTA